MIEKRVHLMRAGYVTQDLQLLFLLFPTSVLCLREFFDRCPVGFDCACPLLMFRLGFFDCCLGLRDCLLPSVALLDRGGFFLAALAFALLLLSLKRECSFAGCFIV